LVAGVHYAVEQQADIILCGWATRKESSALKLALQRAEAAGIPVIVAAGDRGKSFDSNSYFPAQWASEVSNILVAVNSDGANTNFGTTLRSLAAPGKNIPVTRPLGEWARASSSGLSAAFIAGGLARFMRDHPERRLRTPEGASYWIQELLRRSSSEVRLRDRVSGGRLLKLQSLAN
jgi:major intracellular serine protease